MQTLLEWRQDRTLIFRIARWKIINLLLCNVISKNLTYRGDPHNWPALSTFFSRPLVLWVVQTQPLYLSGVLLLAFDQLLETAFRLVMDQLYEQSEKERRLQKLRFGERCGPGNFSRCLFKNLTSDTSSEVILSFETNGIWSFAGSNSPAAEQRPNSEDEDGDAEIDVWCKTCQTLSYQLAHCDNLDYPQFLPTQSEHFWLLQQLLRVVSWAKGQLHLQKRSLPPSSYDFEICYPVYFLMNVSTITHHKSYHFPR